MCCRKKKKKSAPAKVPKQFHSKRVSASTSVSAITPKTPVTPVRPSGSAPLPSSSQPKTPELSEPKPTPPLLPSAAECSCSHHRKPKKLTCKHGKSVHLPPPPPEPVKQEKPPAKEKEKPPPKEETEAPTTITNAFQPGGDGDQQSQAESEFKPVPKAKKSDKDAVAEEKRKAKDKMFFQPMFDESHAFGENSKAPESVNNNNGDKEASEESPKEKLEPMSRQPVDRKAKIAMTSHKVQDSRMQDTHHAMSTNFSAPLK